MDEITPIYTLSLVGHCAHCDITASKIEEAIFAPKYIFLKKKDVKKVERSTKTERNDFSKIVVFC